MKTVLIGSGVVAAFALAGAAFADNADGASKATEKFAEMDVNTDGAVTSEEYVAYAAEAGGLEASEAELQFAVMAGDDGILALEELAAIMEVEKNASDWEASATSDMETETDETGAEAASSDHSGSES